MESGDPAALEAAITAAGDATAQDLLRVQLAVDSPQQADSLCARVTTEFAKEKCQQVLGRPHLRPATP
jgi:hypothetical protein